VTLRLLPRPQALDYKVAMNESVAHHARPTHHTPKTARVMRWWWVRHAPVTVDQGCIYGHIDLPCDVSDADCFAVLARRLPRDAVWVTSHLQRTKQTAAAIAAAGLAFDAAAEERDFAEQHFGEWQGRLAINYSWGNQQGTEHLAAAVYDGSLAQFLRGWFPNNGEL